MFNFLIKRKSKSKSRSELESEYFDLMKNSDTYEQKAFVDRINDIKKLQQENLRLYDEETDSDYLKFEIMRELVRLNITRKKKRKV